MSVLERTNPSGRMGGKTRMKAGEGKRRRVKPPGEKVEGIITIRAQVVPL